MTQEDGPSSPYLSIKNRAKRMVAVALKGDAANPEIPARIVASGYGAVAEQILELAFEKGVKVREDADLATLLAQLDLDTPIPSAAIVVIGEILAKVYQANARLSAEPYSPGTAHD